MENIGEVTGTKHFLYRCFKCGNIITCLKIQDIWGKATGTVQHPALCPCGSAHVNPTNAKLWEELTHPSIWVLWWKLFAKPWIIKKLGK